MVMALSAMMQNQEKPDLALTARHRAQAMCCRTASAHGHKRTTSAMHEAIDCTIRRPLPWLTEMDPLTGNEELPLGVWQARQQVKDGEYP